VIRPSKLRSGHNNKKNNIFTYTDNLGFKELAQHGLNWAPQGAMKLSEGKYDDLLNYIESVFEFNP